MNTQIRYVQSSDGTRIGMCTLGSGRPLVIVTNFYASIDLLGEVPEASANLERLAQKRQVVLFDARGVGYSSQLIRDFSLDANFGDLDAVVGALESDTVDVLSSGPPSRIAAAYAARRPERMRRLVLDSCAARGADSTLSDRLQALLPLAAVDWKSYLHCLALLNFGWTEVGRRVAERQAKEAKRGVWRESSNQGALEDISGELQNIKCPTLVMIQEGGSSLFQNLVPPHRIMEVAAAIPNSKIVKYSPDHAIPLSGSWDAFLGIVESFLDEGQEQPQAVFAVAPSGTAVIFFADIVDSTALTERLGDAAFRDKARALDTALRAIIRDNAGTPVEGKLLGDGVLAVFTSARQAIAAALKCGVAGEDGGLPLHLGIHAGDVMREKDPDGRDNVYGGAVNIAARIAGESAAGEVLVSQTVRELARTSAGVAFEDAGERELKGVGEPIGVWRVRSA